MRLEESSIYINLLRLREKVYGAQFHMTKADRMIYGQPLNNASGEALGNYILAFMNKENKLSYMDKCISWFTRLRVDLDFCVRENIIKFKKKQNNDVSSQKIELFAIIGKIDSDICKWRASLAKGKTLCE